MSQLVKAQEAISAGDLKSARSILNHHLQLRPGDLDGLYLLGICEQASGMPDAARNLYARILEAMPGHFGAHYNLALLLSGTGRDADALPHHDAAVELQPRQVWAHINRGNALIRLHRISEAIKAYEHALHLDSGNFDAWCNKGNALLEANDAGAALGCFEHAGHLQPEAPLAWIGQSKALVEMRRFEQGLAASSRALECDARSADAWCLQGICLSETGQAERSLAAFQMALEIRPAHREAWCSLGNALQTLERFQEALDSLERALQIDPRYVDALVNRGTVLLAMGQQSEACASLEQALALQPQDASAEWNLACALLRQGDYARGWPHYEARWRAKELEFKKASTSRPVWPGHHSREPVLLWGEQGLGDQILFGSILPELQDLPQRKYVALDRRLLPLFRRSMHGFEFIELGLVNDALDFSAQLPLGSLPGIYRRDVEKRQQARHPYLLADRARADRLRALIERPGQLVVGTSWASSRKHIGARKSMALADMVVPLADERLHFVDLQYGDTREERQALAASHGINVQHVDEIDNFEDIDGLAALIQACDIVLTTSNTTAHIAGALGKTTLLLLPLGKGRLWYWADAEGHNRWYPSIRTYAQARPGDWSQPLSAVKSYLDAV